MLSALEIIESLKNNMNKADESVNKKNIDKKNPSFSAIQAEENFNQINQTYDNQVIMTEKDIDRSKDIRLLNSSTEFNLMKSTHKNKKENNNNNDHKNITAINASVNTNENNYNMEVNNTYEGEYYSNKDKKNFGNNNANNLRDIKSVSPYKNSKSTTNKKNIQINIPDNLNQYSIGQEKNLNINLYSNKNKQINLNNNINNINYNLINNPNNQFETEKKNNSKNKIQFGNYGSNNNNNNYKSPIGKDLHKINSTNTNTNSKGNFNNNNITNKNNNNNNYKSENKNENFQSIVNNIKNSILTGMNNNSGNNNNNNNPNQNFEGKKDLVKNTQISTFKSTSKVKIK